jgi:hypothetical protein
MDKTRLRSRRSGSGEISWRPRSHFELAAGPLRLPRGGRSRPIYVLRSANTPRKSLKVGWPKERNGQENPGPATWQLGCAQGLLWSRASFIRAQDSAMLLGCV